MTRLRDRLDSWKFWMGIAYLGLSLTVVGLYFTQRDATHTSAKQTKDEAAHTAEIEANALSQYNQCIASRPELQRINAFVLGQRIVDAALLENSEANLAATAKDDPLYQTRVRNVNRLRTAKAAAYHVQFTIPSVAFCQARRAALLKRG